MSTSSKSHLSMNAIIAGMKAGAGAAQLPIVEIKQFALAGEGLARVTVEVTHNRTSRTDHSVIKQAIEQKLEGRMTAVAGSFNILEKGNFVDRLSGVVSVKREVVPVTEENLKGFRATASNMFMDDEQDMWVLRKTEAGDLLVKTTGIDDDMTLVKLLESNSSAGFRNTGSYGVAVASANAIAEGAAGGDFVSYVNINNTVAHGYVVASADEDDRLVVLPVGGKDGEVINRQAITEVHGQKDFPAIEQSGEEEVNQVVASARGEIDLPFLLDFYKRIYQRSPQFYAMFADRLNAHTFF